MATGGIKFEITSSKGEGFRDLQIVNVKRLCRICGEWKDEALDVCWDPELRCKKDVA